MNGTKRLVLAALCAAAATQAQAQVQAKLWVNGTSTVQPFKCTARSMDAQVRGLPDETRLTLATLATAGLTASVRIDATALDCANDTMNDHMWNALVAKQHPKIRFEVKGYQLGAVQGGKAKLSLEGELTLAGVTRPARMDAVAAELPDGALDISGEHAFNMKDFGVKPPELFFGAMKVDPKVVVGFNLRLSPASAGAAVSAGQR